MQSTANVGEVLRIPEAYHSLGPVRWGCLKGVGGVCDCPSRWPEPASGAARSCAESRREGRSVNQPVLSRGDSESFFERRLGSGRNSPCYVRTPNDLSKGPREREAAQDTETLEITGKNANSRGYCPRPLLLTRLSQVLEAKAFSSPTRTRTWNKLVNSRTSHPAARAYRARSCGHPRPAPRSARRGRRPAAASRSGRLPACGPRPAKPPLQADDAPSLHAADVGISVATAVDVARDAAEIILLKPGLAVVIGAQSGLSRKGCGIRIECRGSCITWFILTEGRRGT